MIPTSTAASPVDDVVAPAAVAAVLRLVGRLRETGIAVSTGEVIDAVVAVAAIDVESRSQVRLALRATLIKDGVRLRDFDRAFDAVFPVQEARPPEGTTEPQANDAPGVDDFVRALRDDDEESLRDLLTPSVEAQAAQFTGRSVEHHTQRVLRQMDLAEIHRRYLADPDSRSDFERSLASADAQRSIEELRALVEQMMGERIPASAAQAESDLVDVDLLRARPDQLAGMRAALRPLARRLASRLGQRKRRGRGSLDMRRTIRASLATGGVPVSPALRRRRPTRPDLVVLCDVSGSTAEFAPFTLALLHAVHQEFSRVRSFVFVDGVVEITDILESSPGVLDPRLLLDRRGLVVGDGRSDYRRALRSFLDTWPAAVTARTSVLIVGDSRSHDREPALAEVAALQHEARRLYWLNPEPAAEWDTGDSRVAEYAPLVTALFEVSTLRQLVDAIAEIA